MNSTQVMSRNEAREAGLIIYNNGRPCPQGHSPMRYTKSAKCIECLKERHKAPHIVQARTIRMREWQKKEDRNKRICRQRVNQSLKNGSLSRLPCEVCGTTTKVQAHHEDYNKPLEVMWLCPCHHKQRHAEIDKAKKDLQ